MIYIVVLLGDGYRWIDIRSSILISILLEEIDISPIYHNNKTSFNPNFPDEIINIQKIDATDAKKANKIALTALNSGANGLCFSSPNNLDILLKDIKTEFYLFIVLLTIMIMVLDQII